MHYLGEPCYHAFHWTRVEQFCNNKIDQQALSFWYVSYHQLVWVCGQLIFSMYILCAVISQRYTPKILSHLKLSLPVRRECWALSPASKYWNTATTSLGLIVSVVPTAILSQVTWHVITELCHNMPPTKPNMIDHLKFTGHHSESQVSPWHKHSTCYSIPCYTTSKESPHFLRFNSGLVQKNHNISQQGSHPPKKTKPILPTYLHLKQNYPFRF